ncbi:MAG: hypothetical protein CMK07_09475 [Ponticaulis sp.]|nr:hypothetical protein [Ponticaulis sp.]
MKYAFIPLVTLLMPVAAQADDIRSGEDVVAAMIEGVTHVDNDYVEQRISENPDILILDVRTGEEFENGRIEGARNVPRGVVEFRMAAGTYPADQEIIVTCSHGYRAAAVTKTLQEMGYTNVNAHRGMNSWMDAGKTYETELGLSQLKSRDD